jgi:hypothetical protein
MLRRDNNLINARGINNNPPINCSSPAIQQDFETFKNDLLHQHGVHPNRRMLSPNPPFEKHPYLQYVSKEFFEKYIIGTFPPISYVIDLLLAEYGLAITHLIQPNGVGTITEPYIPFFHGNFASFWKFILTNEEFQEIRNTVNRGERKEKLLKWLNENRIIYSDIIKSTQRELDDEVSYNSEDQYLHNICINTDLICHIMQNSNAKFLMFNTSNTFGRNTLLHLNRNQNGSKGQVNVNTDANSFDLFIRGCQELGIKVEFRINQGPTILIPWVELNAVNAPYVNQNFKNKIAFEIRLTITNKVNPDFIKSCLNGITISKELTVITGPSPSSQAVRGVGGNHNYLAWQVLNPNSTTTDFIRYVHNCFRNNMFNNLYALNL